MSISLSQLASHAAGELERKHRQNTLAYAWPHPWAGGNTIEVAGRTLALRYCASELALREALLAHADDPQVLLVGVPENRMGEDVLARIARHRLLHVDRWQLVRGAFGVRQIDPRLLALDWLPDELLAARPDGYHSPAPVLTFDQAMQACLSACLDLSERQPSLEDLLLACQRNGSQWSRLPQALRTELHKHLESRFGGLTTALVKLMDAGNSHAMVATGLACDVLFAKQPKARAELRDARVRLESHLDGYRLKPVEGRQWADSATSLLHHRSPDERRNDQNLATRLLQDCGADAFLSISRSLPAALDARLAKLDQTIQAFLRSNDKLAEVEAAGKAVREHMAPADDIGKQAAQMAVRLCRSLVQTDITTSPSPAVAYREHGAWQDWARRSLNTTGPGLFAKLLDRVAESRLDADRQFAEQLAARLQLGEAPAGLTLIEAALDQYVAPLARDSQVLMVVLDGMSMDIAHTLDMALAQDGWHQWSRQQERVTLLATTPSVTECSRASLLSGRLARGPARVETRQFAEHAGLRRHASAKHPPVLFHKGGLGQSHHLSDEVLAALRDTKQKVVAVVINAIDDSLAKSEQVRIDWSIESIPLLHELLGQARQTGRAVVLTSDHGHVLERKSRLAGQGSGERYRQAGKGPGEGEALVTGPRVQSLMDKDIVVPWREDLRYAPKKNGYHGGICRQEMLVPFSIWTTSDASLPDSAWHPVHTEPPAWWDDAVANMAQAAAAKPSRSRSRGASAPVDDLFASPQQNSVIESLLASPTLQRQRQRVGRTAIKDDRLAALLSQFERGDGRASLSQLAQAASVAPLRMRGVISGLERLLNVDGFAVLSFEQDSGTVVLNMSLLRKQFEL